LLDAARVARFEFPLSGTQVGRPARLRIHAADQSNTTPATIAVWLNGQVLEKRELPKGLGIQRTDPAHLAFPATVEFAVRANAFRLGQNVIEVRVEGDGWFSWDAMNLIQLEKSQ
jgi:beta-mannosidase